ncbi:MAG: ankyrin repeat domain-containing protein [Candidatus Dependentiae bacterium]
MKIFFVVYALMFCLFMRAADTDEVNQTLSKVITRFDVQSQESMQCFLERVDLCMAYGATFEKAKIDINKKCGSHSLFELAILHKRWGLATKLVDQGAGDMFTRDACCRDVLHLVVNEGQIELLQRLLDKDRTPDPRDQVGETPLHYAVRVGNPQIVELLLRKRANKFEHSNALLTPGMLAQELKQKQAHVEDVSKYVQIMELFKKVYL